MRVKRVSATLGIAGETHLFPLLPDPRPGLAYEIWAIHADGRQNAAGSNADFTFWYGLLNGFPATAKVDVVNHSQPVLTDGFTAFSIDQGAPWLWINGTPISGSSSTLNKHIRPTWYPMPRALGPLVHQIELVASDSVGSAVILFSVYYERIELSDKEWAAYRNDPIVDEQFHGTIL